MKLIKTKQKRKAHERKNELNEIKYRKGQVSNQKITVLPQSPLNILCKYAKDIKKLSSFQTPSHTSSSSLFQALGILLFLM